MNIFLINDLENLLVAFLTIRWLFWGYFDASFHVEAKSIAVTN